MGFSCAYFESNIIHPRRVTFNVRQLQALVPLDAVGCSIVFEKTHGRAHVWFAPKNCTQKPILYTYTTNSKCQIKKLPFCTYGTRGWTDLSVQPTAVYVVRILVCNFDSNHPRDPAVFDSRNAHAWLARNEKIRSGNTFRLWQMAEQDM